MSTINWFFPGYKFAIPINISKNSTFQKPMLLNFFQENTF